MLKAIIEIDNNTASPYSPIEWIKRYIIKDCGNMDIQLNKKQVVYKTPYATITFKNLRQI